MEIRRSAFLPNLFTLGNGVCGFAALVKILKVKIVEDPLTGAHSFANPELFGVAAWLILLGMLFDVFDGKVARLAGKTSDLGAELDSMCDLTTFGLAPAVLVVRLNMVYDDVWGKLVWFFCLAYFLGALLRLARFSIENDHSDSAHLCFKGLPSPAAAGCVASLVIFFRYIANFKERELVWLSRFLEKEVIQGAVGWIPVALPVLMIFLGYTMVSSRLKYVHVANRILRRQPFEFFVSLVFGILLAAVFPEIVLPIVFIGYLAYTPVSASLRWILRRREDPLLSGMDAGGSGDIEEILQGPPGERTGD